MVHVKRIPFIRLANKDASPNFVVVVEFVVVDIVVMINRYDDCCCEGWDAHKYSSITLVHFYPEKLAEYQQIKRMRFRRTHKQLAHAHSPSPSFHPTLPL